MNYEKYLPVGTVVMLKGGSKRAMITGFCSVANEDKTKMYDYSGCLFPEGILKSDQTLLFNHEQIDKIYHLGLVDDEEKSFKQKLKEVINKINETTEKELNINNTGYSVDNSANAMPNLNEVPVNNVFSNNYESSSVNDNNLMNSASINNAPTNSEINNSFTNINSDINNNANFNFDDTLNNN